MIQGRLGCLKTTSEKPRRPYFETEKGKYKIFWKNQKKRGETRTTKNEIED